MNMPTKNIKPYTEALMQRVPEGPTCPLNLLTNNMTPYTEALMQKVPEGATYH